MGIFSPITVAPSTAIVAPRAIGRTNAAEDIIGKRFVVVVVVVV